MSLRPGRHGTMSSGEFENIITRNGNFLTVRRAGSGDGQAGLFCSLTGQYIGGVGGGDLPEYTRMRDLQWDCPCTPGGKCRSGEHGTYMIRGWRNLLFEFVSGGRVKATPEIIRVLGAEETAQAVAKLYQAAPKGDPNVAWAYSQLGGR